MFLVPNSMVVVVSDDEGMEMGMLLNQDESGIILNVTHRLEIEHKEASEEDRGIAEGVFAEMDVKDLRTYAREHGLDIVRSFLWKTERLRKACLGVALRKMETEVQVLKPLARPVEQWISFAEAKRILNASQFLEEKTLNQLDFDINMSEIYDESKTKAEDSDK